jgi:hypothetical protein
MNRVIVFGGYGVFGSHIARALVEQGIPTTIAGRDPVRADQFACSLGDRARGKGADLGSMQSCLDAIQGHAVAVHAAGPFGALDDTLLKACAASQCHYVDIADDRGYAAKVLGLSALFSERGLAAVYGCSSLPGISGALGLLAYEGATSPVSRVRSTLFIGNRNPKGIAAIRSLLGGLGQPIAAPQGTLRGYRDREVVELPPPFGGRGVFNFDSPDYDLFGPLFDAKEVVVKVGFELRTATYAFAALSYLGARRGAWLARIIEFTSRGLGWLGCSGGAVMTELLLENGAKRVGSIGGARDGQRMAALPAAMVAASLATAPPLRTGSCTAYEFLGAKPLLDQLVRAGYSLSIGGAAP